MAKKQDKSSKTAHVLNLLTSPAEKQAAAQKAAAAGSAEEPAEAAPSSEAVEAAEVNQQAAQVRQPLIPPILQVAHHHDESLAEKIRGALEEEIGAAPAAAPAPIAPQTPAAEPTPQPETVPAEPVSAAVPEFEPELEIMPEPVQEPEAMPELAEPEPVAPAPETAPAPVASAEPVSEPVAVEPVPVAPAEPTAEPAPAPQPVIAPQPEVAAAEPEPRFNLASSAIISSFTIPEPPPLPPLQEELTFVNIMQILVDNMAADYVKKMGLCGCTRCLEDVKALALTNLRPRYTVFPVSERVPMMTLYERRYRSLVAAELTKACCVVKANPRHK